MSLQTIIQQIKNATLPVENTALRVGSAFEQMDEIKRDKSDSLSTSEIIELVNSVKIQSVTGSKFIGDITPISIIPTGDVWGFAEEGTYPNAGGIIVPMGKSAILSRVSDTWSMTEVTPEIIQNTINNIVNINQTIDPGQIVPSEALYNNLTESLAVNIEKRIDFTDGYDVNYNVAAMWYDGTPITAARIDEDIFISRDGVYKRKMIDKNALLKISNVGDLRAKNAYYEGQEVTLLGYYISGDKKPLNYKFTISNFDTNVDDGGSIIKSSKGSWIAQFNGVVTPRDFGAKGDNSNDDSDSIQKMFNSAPVKSNIYFPIGFYKVTKKITIPIDREFVIEGAKSVSDGGTTPETRFNGLSSILWYGEDITETAVFDFIDTQSRVRMRYLNFSNRTTRTDVDGILFKDFRGAYLQFIYLNQFKNNIYVDGDAYYAKLEKCKLMQSKENGIYVKGLSNGMKFDECRISSNLKKGAFFLKAASDVTFDHCYIEQNLEQGLYFTQPQLININNCHFENNGYEVLTNPSQIYVGNYTDLNNTDAIINVSGNYFFSRGGINIIQTNAGVLGTGSKIISNLIGNYVTVTNNTKGNTCFFVNISINQNNNLINAVSNTYKTLSVDVNTPVLTNVVLTNLKAFTAINDNSIQTDSIGFKTNRTLSTRYQFTNDFTVLGASLLSGTGNPEGVSLTANVGSLYLDNTAGLSINDRLWIKQTGTGNTGWVLLLKNATTSVKGLVNQSVTQANSTATDVAGLVTDFNALLAKLKTAGIVA